MLATKNLRTGLIIAMVIFMALVLFIPAVTHGQVDEGGKIVPCGTEKGPITRPDGTTYIGDINPCTFNDFYILIDNVINFSLFYLVIPLATISIAIAGFMLLASGDSDSKRTTAKGIIWWALIGVILAFGAWLIVHTIIGAIVDEKKFDVPLKQSLEIKINSEFYV